MYTLKNAIAVIALIQSYLNPRYIHDYSCAHLQTEMKMRTQIEAKYMHKYKTEIDANVSIIATVLYIGVEVKCRTNTHKGISSFYSN